MTVPHWRRNQAPTRLDADALVVGAGICGVSAALHLERRGLRVAVVERHAICSGASSRNAGFLMRGAADHYADACRAWGRETARTLWRWTEENLEGLRRDGAETLASYRRVPSCLLALDRAQADELDASRRMMEEDGFEVGWTERGDDTAWTVAKPVAGLVNPNDASVNGYDLVRALAGKLKDAIHENQEVYVIEPAPAGGGLLVRTPDLEVHAGHVLVCTNAYAPLLLPALADSVLPRRGQMIGVRRPGSGAAGLRLDACYYVNHGSEYLRQTPDGTVVVGGCRTYFAERECGYEDLTTPYVQEAIERFAESALGPDLEIVARWAGTMGFSVDGVPLVGPVPLPEPALPLRAPSASEWVPLREGLSGPSLAPGARSARPHPRLWFCGAFTGHGMSMAHRTARAAVEAMLDGTPTPFPLSRVFTPHDISRSRRGPGL